METKPGFWKRQFVGQANNNQVLFDIAFGIVGPVLCFAFDPIAFQGDILGPPLFAKYQAFAYLFSGLEIVVLGFWLVFGSKLQFVGTLVSGLLLAGSVFCTILGCLLLPYSLLGIMMVVGILGFTPFVSALVYLRNAYRALLNTNNLAARAPQVAPILLGCVLAFTGPRVAAASVNRMIITAVDQILEGNEEQASIVAHAYDCLAFGALSSTG